MPRAWAAATARLADATLGPALPLAWRDRVERLGVIPSPVTLLEDAWEPDPHTETALLEMTGLSVEASRNALRDRFAGG